LRAKRAKGAPAGGAPFVSAAAATRGGKRWRRGVDANVIRRLQERGLLEDATSPDVSHALDTPITVYAGFDPTSDSLQAGNLAAIMALAHFQRCGHRVIALVGGATGLIGDPSGKSAERALLSVEQIERNALGIRENLARFLDFNHPVAPAEIVNNYDWLGRLGFIEFLREVGKHFRMGAMLGKESVRARLAGDAGMSFAEFSYQLLQAYDFLHLFDTRGCAFQLGGSDQWGNITAGIDLIRKLRNAAAYGVTIPLICDSAGQKFGKSEGNAIYLDRRRTSVYAFYQFFLRSADTDVVRLLKVFTFLPLAEIGELEAQVRQAPEQRAAQRRLAEEVTRAVHGAAGLETAQRASAALFGETMEGLRAEELLEVFRDVPSTELPRSQLEGTLVVDMAAAAGFCKSKSDARRLIASGGLYLNSRRVAGLAAVVRAEDIVDGRIIVLRSGKKTFRLVKVV
jgi:tyrosyl-tRNA synthetase